MDSYTLDHVIVEDCADVPATMYSVTEVHTCDATGTTDINMSLVDKCDMQDFMDQYPEGTRVCVRR